MLSLHGFLPPSFSLSQIVELSSTRAHGAATPRLEMYSITPKDCQRFAHDRTVVTGAEIRTTMF